MDFNEYQKKAQKTAIYPGKGENLYYPTMGLTGEAGEVAEKVKKLLRDFNNKITDEYKLEILKELGDVLWYVTDIAQELGSSLQDVAELNIKKLESRKKRNVIKGNGDNR